MTPHKSASSSASGGRHVKEKTFTLAASKGKSIGLGVFTTGTDPHYKVTSSPDLGEFLGLAREKLPLEGGRYMLLYQFHNFYDKPSEITVRLVDKSDVHGS